jgi:pimeloyl-ACP methyl ester carboxylesterase
MTKSAQSKFAQGKSAAAPRPREARAYFENRYGQLHVHNAIPTGGGFDEGTTLLCLHQSPASGRTFRQFARIAAQTRSVYCPDTPGFGESDPPPSAPSIGDYAAAIGDFVDLMRFRQIDVLGYHTGAAIAVELAIAKPTIVRRLVLVAVPVLTVEERAAFQQAPWPVPPAEDGSHLLAEWQRSQRWRGPGVTLDMLAQSFAAKLYNGPQAWWGANAVMQWPARERLALVKQPVLILRPKDDLWDATARAKDAFGNARSVDLPDFGHGLFEVAPQAIAGTVLPFLKA